MLLNKYNSFSLIGKDDFAEELLFKIEQNIGIKKQLEDNCFPLLSLTDYPRLLGYAHKFDHLATTTDYIWQKLAQHINTKANDESKLWECYLLCRQVGDLVTTITNDLRAKSRLIAHEIPVSYFTEGEQARALWVDLWTYKEAIININNHK